MAFDAAIRAHLRKSALKTQPGAAALHFRTMSSERQSGVGFIQRFTLFLGCSPTGYVLFSPFEYGLGQFIMPVLWLFQDRKVGSPKGVRPSVYSFGPRTGIKCHHRHENKPTYVPDMCVAHGNQPTKPGAEHGGHSR